VLSSVWLTQESVVKVTSPLWPHEPAITALLHDMAPMAVPEVLTHGSLRLPGAVGPAPWMVMRRYKQTGAADNRAVLGTLAELQAAALPREVRFRQAGAPQRGALEIAADLPLLWDEAIAAGLSAPDAARVPELEAWLTARLKALATQAPLLLTHGDLHAGNVLMTRAQGPGSLLASRDPEVRPVIFDWTDAALAWPGVDLLTLTRYGLSRAPQAGELGRLKLDYLQAARAAFAKPALSTTLSALEATLDEGVELAVAYHAVSYAHIVRSVPQRQKPFVGSAFLVRAIRQLLEQLDAS
jgi:aminoglycoside phosphotransferase (APT) family kinase protein